jgi:hypothetical protein
MLFPKLRILDRNLCSESGEFSLYNTDKRWAYILAMPFTQNQIVVYGLMYEAARFRFQCLSPHSWQCTSSDNQQQVYDTVTSHFHWPSCLLENNVLGGPDSVLRFNYSCKFWNKNAAFLLNLFVSFLFFLLMYLFTGIHRDGRGDNVEIECGDKDWVYVTRDRYQWQVAMNIAINDYCLPGRNAL